MIVRFQYTKLGNAVYIGHLEMTKLFERAFRRSGVIVKYTEGFNPTVKLNFASPLSVGIESEYEVAEVEIEDGSFEHFSRLLLPLGIQILDYKQVEKGVPLMSRLAYSSYCLRPEPNQAEAPALTLSHSLSDWISERLRWFSEQGEILFEKRTKKGSKTVNMKAFVKDIRLSEAGICLATLVSGNNGSLNPVALSGVLFPDCRVKIKRILLADENEKELYLDV